MPQVIWKRLLLTSSVPVLNADLRYECHLMVVLAARNADSGCHEVKMLELAEIFSKSMQAALISKEKDSNSD